ncbi:hypothetical protein [Sutcliffiella horikoshii]
MREHLEVIYHRDAILYAEDIVQKDEPFQNGRKNNFIVCCL